MSQYNTTKPRYGQGRACDMAPCAHDTAGWGLRHSAGGLRHGLLGAPRYGHARAPGRACAHLGVLAGPADYALGAPSLFFDSVLFLSYCLDTAHEHCSSQKKIEKKLIK